MGFKLVGILFSLERHTNSLYSTPFQRILERGQQFRHPLRLATLSKSMGPRSKTRSNYRLMGCDNCDLAGPQHL